jgi:post-segregation antitoxin (ccd killing protein)
MTTLELKLNLPDDLAQRAQSAGLLTSEAIESMLCEQLRKRAGENLRAMWARMPREELTPQIEQEIVEEVRAARAERRNQSGS